MLHGATRKLLGETKVGKHDVAIGSDKDIFRLEVTIDDTRCVQALDTLNDFGSIEAGTVAPQATPPC
jgi:hypothetical protein